MSIVGGAVETFEGQAKRLLWLPALTLGYIFTMTGDPLHFALTVLAIAGGKYSSDLKDWRDEQEYEEGEWWLRKYFNLILNHYPKRKLWVTFVIMVGFVFATVYGLILLYNHFDYRDPVLVGFAAIYWAVLLLLLQS